MAQVAHGTRASGGEPAPPGGARPPLRWSGTTGGDGTGGAARAGWALTGRDGGVSTGPAAGLNLGDHVGDDPAAVSRNRSRLAAALPGRVAGVVWARQVHGRGVAVVGAGDLGGAPPVADALVTTEPALALAVVVADCVPVLVAADGVVGVAHAGRRGMDLGVVPALVAAVRELAAGGSAGGDAPVHAVVGPSVCGRCYAVPGAMCDDVAGRHPAARSATRAGEPALDVAAGVLAQLDAAGALVVRVGGCTVEDPRLFSVRRDGAATGRGAGLVWRDDARRDDARQDDR